MTDPLSSMPVLAREVIVISAWIITCERRTEPDLSRPPDNQTFFLLLRIGADWADAYLPDSIAPRMVVELGWRLCMTSIVGA